MPEERDPPFLVFGAPDIREDEIREVEETLRSGWIGTGPRVARFESAFADYQRLPAERVAAVNSCTAALHVSMIAAGLGPGDEVLTTAMTFCATANAIIHAGATPVPVDIDPRTLNLDASKIEEKITPRTRAIVPVHFAGRPCDMDAIMDIARRHDLLVVEDCAHAIETEWKGAKVGSFGQFGCFSFYVTKNVVTGEGGMVVARSQDDIARIKILALHGMTKDAWHRFGDEGYKHYQVVEAGFKYNMMDLQAAIGIHHLRRIDQSWLRRQEIWRRYQDALADVPVELPMDPSGHMRHGYHLFSVLIDKDRCGMDRDAFIAGLTARRIGIGVHYLSLTDHPYYQKRFGWRSEQCPIAYRHGRRTVSLPLSPKLTDSDVDWVIDGVSSVLRGG